MSDPNKFCINIIYHAEFATWIQRKVVSLEKKKNDAGHRLCMRQLFHALFFSKQRLKMVIQVFMGIEKLNHGKKKYGRVNNVTCIASRTQCLYCPTLFKHTIERRKVRL